MKVKNKKSIIFLFGLSLVFIVIGVIAYFSNNEIMQNRFISGTYKTVTRETFTSPTNWIPGQETEKSIVTKNEGTIPVRVRVKLDESWTSKNNDPLDLEYNGEKAAIINFDNESDWLKKGDYYYYLEELAPGDETSSLIKSVTFNSNVEPDILCTTSNNVYTCESTGDGYDGATYELDITTETVQANKYREVWGNDSPIMYDYVGDNPCTFNGELVPGVEYVNGQYTYMYMSEWTWMGTVNNIADLGWGVRLSDSNSTSPVTSTLCSSINNKPVVSMNSMFFKAKASDIDISSFDTSNVTNMSWMFDAVEITELDISNFDTGNVTNMSGMFYYNKLTNLDLGNIDTSNVKDMSYMFEGSLLTSLDFSGFDTSSVTNMDCMFGESEIQSLDLSGFDTSNVTNMSDMFYWSMATTINLTGFDTSNVTDMSFMFGFCNATSLNLSSFDTSNVTNMSSMFAGSQATTLDLSSFDTSNVTNMSDMFYRSMATTINLTGFDTSNVTNMEEMFCNTSNLNVIDLSSYDVSNVSNTVDMFKGTAATTGYGKTQADCDIFNASEGKPSGLVFVVKGS